MKLIFGLVVLSVVAVVEIFADDRCGEGRVWKICTSPCRAVPTCQSPNVLLMRKICPAVCTSGCVCAKGYVMDNERCIPRSQCPKRT